MKIREITPNDVTDYIKIDKDDVDAVLRKQIEAFLAAAKQYVLSETGLSKDEADEYEDLTVAVLIICQDLYDNRARYITDSKSKPSATLESILGFYRCNLL